AKAAQPPASQAGAAAASEGPLAAPPAAASTSAAVKVPPSAPPSQPLAASADQAAKGSCDPKPKAGQAAPPPSTSGPTPAAVAAPAQSGAPANTEEPSEHETGADLLDDLLGKATDPSEPEKAQQQAKTPQQPAGADAAAPAASFPEPAPAGAPQPVAANAASSFVQQGKHQAGADGPAAAPTPVGGTSTPRTFDQVDLLEAACLDIGADDGQDGFRCPRCKLDLPESERIADADQKKCAKDVCAKCHGNAKTLQKRFKKNKQLKAWWAGKNEGEQTRWFAEHRECA
ncbi:unnamed protein product, partial [Prorocentrum cordatum]